MQCKWIAGLTVLLATLVFSSAAKPDWRSDIGVFRVGVVTQSQDARALEGAEPFRVALSEALDMEVEFFKAGKPRALIDAFASDRIEYAIFSSFAYALGSVVCECIEPLVSPRAIDSTDGYHLVLISRVGDAIAASSLPGKTIAMLSDDNMAENLLLKNALSAEGVDIGRVNFTALETGEMALEAFVAGQFDVLAGWSSMTGNPSEGYSRGTLRLIGQRQLGSPGDYSVFWQSKQIPHRVHVVGKKLPGEAKNILRNLMNSLHDRDPVSYDAIEPVYGGGFVTTRHSRFEPLLSIVESINEAGQTAEAADQETKNPPQN